MMNVEEIELIIKLVRKYGLGSLYIENDNFKLKVEDHKNAMDNVKSVNEDKSNKLPQISDSEDCIIKSPLVGNASVMENKVTSKKYAVGDEVQTGQAICTIEAMKMINEIICNEDGIITEILIEDTQFVEYEQPLFKIRNKR